jgi:hypothetical protein
VTAEGDQAETLLRILEKNRADHCSSVPADLLADIAELQQQNQFDDDRRKTQKAIREIVEQYAKQIALKEGSQE